MGIYVLIIVCFYTLGGLGMMLKGIRDDEPNEMLFGFIKSILGIIAIVFQSTLIS